ncbi:MAG: NYN domain-containing protein [Mesorhizobium amorphae]|nr:MAG: NYN domain-containing protein [Mesorhizobium amorphae]
MFDPREKIALFIDGANLYATSRALGFDIDYRKLLGHFGRQGYLLRAYYYTALVEDQEYSSIRPLIDWLDYNGYKVVTKPAKEFTDASGRRKVKGNMDIELTVEALALADVVDHFVIFSGDGDFRVLVEALQKKGRKVSVVATIAAQGSVVADELRRQADHFIELNSLKADVGREPSERAPRRIEPAAGLEPAQA